MILVKERIVDNCKEGDSMLVKYMFFSMCCIILSKINKRILAIKKIL